MSTLLSDQNPIKVHDILKINRRRYEVIAIYPYSILTRPLRKSYKYEVFSIGDLFKAGYLYQDVFKIIKSNSNNSYFKRVI